MFNIIINILQEVDHPQDITTFITDGFLAIEGLYFVLSLLFSSNSKKSKLNFIDKKTRIIWAFTFFNIFIFAGSGAISHGTSSSIIADAFWPLTMIGGGLAFFFFNLGVLNHLKTIQNNLSAKDLINPLLFLSIYLISLPLFHWYFIIFVVYQLLCSFFIYNYACPYRKTDERMAMWIKGLNILLIAGFIQAIGSIMGFVYYYGSYNQFIFKPHNDIFHLISAYALWIIYSGITLKK